MFRYSCLVFLLLFVHIPLALAGSWEKGREKDMDKCNEQLRNFEYTNEKPKTAPPAHTSTEVVSYLYFTPSTMIKMMHGLNDYIQAFKYTAAGPVNQSVFGSDFNAGFYTGRERYRIFWQEPNKNRVHIHPWIIPLLAYKISIKAGGFQSLVESNVRDEQVILKERLRAAAIDDTKPDCLSASDVYFGTKTQSLAPVLAYNLPLADFIIAMAEVENRDPLMGLDFETLYDQIIDPKNMSEVLLKKMIKEYRDTYNQYVDIKDLQDPNSKNKHTYKIRFLPILKTQRKNAIYQIIMNSGNHTTDPSIIAAIQRIAFYIQPVIGNHVASEQQMAIGKAIVEELKKMGYCSHCMLRTLKDMKSYLKGNAQVPNSAATAPKEKLPDDYYERETDPPEPMDDIFDLYSG